MSSIDDKSFRKKVYYKIKKIKNKDIFFKIYDKLKEHKQHFNVNTNGVFFDIYKISLDCVKDINTILINESINTEDDSITYNNYSEDVNNNEKINNTDKTPTIPKTNIDKIISHSIL